MKLKFFDLAKKLSNKSDYCHKLGAVVVKKNKVLGIGFNKPHKTSPRSLHPFQKIHAELDAILDCNRDDVKGSTIYVYREFKDGTLANSKPCQYCEIMLKRAGIKKVCYTDNGEYKELEI